MSIDNSLFEKSAKSCKEVLSAESTLLLSRLNGCGEAIRVFQPSFVGAVTAGATTATMVLVAPNIAGDRVILKPGQQLKYTVASVVYTATVASTSSVAFGVSTTVTFATPFPVAIAANTATNNVVTTAIEGSIEPKLYQIETGVANVIGAKVINLRLASPNVAGDTMFLRKGSILRLTNATNGVVTIAEDTTIVFSTFTPVPVLNTLVVFPIGTVAPQLNYETFQLLSTTDLPVSFNDQTEDTTDHASGMQYSTVKTKYDITTQVAYRLRCDDLALKNIVLPTADSNDRHYAILSQGALDGCGLLLIGEIQITNVQQAAPVSNIVTGSFTIQWQSPTIVLSKLSELSAVEVTEYLKIAQAFMIPPRTV